MTIGMIYTIGSKHNAIRKRLLMGYGITGHEALYKFGVYRLSSIIHRLRTKDNLPIITRIQDGYAKYFLDPEYTKKNEQELSKVLNQISVL